MINSLSLSKKIWLVVAVLLISLGINSFLAMTKLHELEDSIKFFSETLIKRTLAISQIRNTQNRIIIKSMEVILQTNDEKLEIIEEESEKDYLLEEENFKQYLSIASPEGKKIFQEEYLPNYKIFLDKVKKVHAYGIENKNDLATKEFFSAEAEFNILREKLALLTNFVEKASTSFEKQSIDAAEMAIKLTILIFIISTLIAIFLAYIIIKKLTKDLNLIAENLNQSSTEVTSASIQIARTSDGLAQSTIEQSTSLQQTSTSLHEIATMVTKNAESALGASKKSEVSIGKANQGQEVLNRMINAIDEIKASNQDIMAEINSSSTEYKKIIELIKLIEDKTKVINEIVFQTKLLSFNASVEAARAGEHGKGFAIVAEEVGNLAVMSGNAAKDITELLNNSVHQVESTISNSTSKISKIGSTGNQKVQEGVEVAKECAESINAIILELKQIDKMVNEISIASNEQSKGVSEISNAISTLNQATHENTVLSQESAVAADSLEHQSKKLQDAVHILVDNLNGKN